MKKILSAFIILMLCMTAACAEVIPSKTADDMIQIEVAVDGGSDETPFTITVVPDVPEYEEKIQVFQSEIAALSESESVESYFGTVKSVTGEAIDLTEVLGTENLNVHEFCPIIAHNYEETYGNVVATMQFATPYESGEKVILLIGIVTVNDAGIQTIEWIAFEGVGTGVDGCIEVELTSEIIVAVQSGNALMAVVSK